MINNLAINNVQLIWVLIFLLLLQDIKRKIVKTSVNEWDRSSILSHGSLRKRSSAAGKLYSTLTTKNMSQLAESVAIEMCRDAGIYLNKTIFYFLKLRQDPKELMTYFDNTELIFFMFKPDIWVNQYIRDHRGGFRLIGRQRKQIDKHFLDNLSRLLDTFRKELVGNRQKITKEQFMR